MKLLLITLVLLITAQSLYAQSNLVVYDADGIRVGTVLTIMSWDGNMEVYTPDGYVIAITKYSSGMYSSPLYYATVDCAGKAYAVRSGGSERIWLTTGGYIFRDANSTTVHARVEWATLWYLWGRTSPSC
jgi:hypothetical protein